MFIFPLKMSIGPKLEIIFLDESALIVTTRIITVSTANLTQWCWKWSVLMLVLSHTSQCCQTCYHESTLTVANGITKRVVVEMVSIDLTPQSLLLWGSYVRLMELLGNYTPLIEQFT